jgi:hypothetical protein
MQTEIPFPLSRTLLPPLHLRFSKHRKIQASNLESVSLSQLFSSTKNVTNSTSTSTTIPTSASTFDFLEQFSLAFASPESISNTSNSVAMQSLPPPSVNRSSTPEIEEILREEEHEPELQSEPLVDKNS